ncbi:ATP-binding protein [Edaphobacillus lindanitolerans]|uniref:Uncharacterized protein YhaN n=1 Tax=Edaphobacillus lindanitolerans TaxID=550447 RepID=A0A1U7PQK8_9BACI|nr:AAA family ATPase [Edaphobacillus lindanitolerans]SIT90883.1 Uncharacterized protein YhaN [Edaphobacillus lindanitolerans]
MMQINKLVIYGFGKHSDITVCLDRGINVLYGGNEAGKTTMRQFILHTLFGFPARNANLLRYEPKAGGAYGGQLHVTDPQYGPCVIERVAGRSAGEVTVRFPDGRTGGEEILALLLRGHDRQSFESIFSFSLLQLQEIGKMNEEELGRALIASGTTGADDLAAFESRMQRETDGLFKKSGRLPEMNAMISELRKMEEELADHRKKADGYAPMRERSAEAGRRLDEISREMMEHERQRRTLEVARQALPLESRRRLIEEELAQLGDAPFPADGVRRYESVKERELAANAAIASVRARVGKLDTAMPEATDGALLAEVTAALSEEPAWHEARSEARRLEESLAESEEEKAGLISRLGLEGTAVLNLRSADTSLQKEEELHRLTARHAAVTEKRRILAGRIADKEEEGKRIALQMDRLGQSGPDDREVDHAARWPQIRRRLAEADAKRNAEQSGKAPVQLLAALGALLVLLAVITRQWLLLPAGLAVAGAAFLFKGKRGTEGLSAAEEKLVAEFGGREEEMERIADRVRHHFAELDRLAEAEERLRGEAEGLRKELESTENDCVSAERDLIHFVGSYGVRGLPSPALVPELFRLVRETQETFRRQEADRRRLDKARQQIDEIRSRAHGLLGNRESDDMLFGRLKDLADGLAAERADRNRMQEERKRLLEELDEQENRRRRLSEEVFRLFREAVADDEAAFYEAADQASRKAALGEELRTIGQQLDLIGRPEFDGILSDEELGSRLVRCQKSLAGLAEERDRLLGERADLEARMAHLLTDRAYDERLQTFEMKKAEFRRLAREWAARKAAASAVARTVGRMKEEKLPDAIRQASRLFSRLTGGAQSALVLTPDGRFEAESRNGLRFGIHELSQATKEQAYIALRFALAMSLGEKAPFPVIMDDPFVHFDKERLGHMIELMEEWKTDRQFLYFTCHDMKTAFKDAAIIDVAGAGSGKDVLTR